jgi:hypothetical protein
MNGLLCQADWAWHAFMLMAAALHDERVDAGLIEVPVVAPEDEPDLEVKMTGHKKQKMTSMTALGDRFGVRDLAADVRYCLAGHPDPRHVPLASCPHLRDYKVTPHCHTPADHPLECVSYTASMMICTSTRGRSTPAAVLRFRWPRSMSRVVARLVLTRWHMGQMCRLCSAQW